MKKIKQGFDEMKATGIALHFFFCAEDADGSPVLLLDTKPISASERKAVLDTAKSKANCQGQLERDAAGTVYVDVKGSAVKDLAKGIREVCMLNNAGGPKVVLGSLEANRPPEVEVQAEPVLREVEKPAATEQAVFEELEQRTADTPDTKYSDDIVKKVKALSASYQRALQLPGDAPKRLRDLFATVNGHLSQNQLSAAEKAADQLREAVLAALGEADLQADDEAVELEVEEPAASRTPEMRMPKMRGDREAAEYRTSVEEEKIITLDDIKKKLLTLSAPYQQAMRLPGVDGTELRRLFAEVNDLVTKNRLAAADTALTKLQDKIKGMLANSPLASQAGAAAAAAAQAASQKRK